MLLQSHFQMAHVGKGRQRYRLRLLAVVGGGASLEIQPYQQYFPVQQAALTFLLLGLCPQVASLYQPYVQAPLSTRQTPYWDAACPLLRYVSYGLELAFEVLYRG